MNENREQYVPPRVIPEDLAEALSEAILAAFLAKRHDGEAYMNFVHSRITRAEYDVVERADQAATEAVWLLLGRATRHYDAAPIPVPAPPAPVRPATDQDGERSVRFEARFDSGCPACDAPISAGDSVAWSDGEVVHDLCAEGAGVVVFDR